MPEEPKEKKTTVANDETKRWRGGKGGEARIEERVNACYSYILEGGTRRQITDRLSQRFGTFVRTADSDYSKAMQLLKEEQIVTREDLLNQIQALRLAERKKLWLKVNYKPFQCC